MIEVKDNIVRVTNERGQILIKWIVSENLSMSKAISEAMQFVQNRSVALV